MDHMIWLHLHRFFDLRNKLQLVGRGQLRQTDENMAKQQVMLGDASLIEYQNCNHREWLDFCLHQKLRHTRLSISKLPADLINPNCHDKFDQIQLIRDEDIPKDQGDSFTSFQFDAD